jgi:hypothetical protein
MHAFITRYSHIVHWLLETGGARISDIMVLLGDAPPEFVAKLS